MDKPSNLFLLAKFLENTCKTVKFQVKMQDLGSGSPLIYFFYVHTTIPPKYMVLFHLFFLLCTTIRPKIRVLIDYFFYLHTAIRPNHIILFHLFFL